MNRPGVPARWSAGAVLTVLVVLTALLAGCTRVPDGSGAVGVSGGQPVLQGDAGASAPAATGAAEVEEWLPTVAWLPGPGEVSPEVKTAATQLVELAGSWDDGSGAPEEMAARLAAGGLPADLAASAGQLAHADADQAAVEVLYPQYGGLTTDQASVMVLVRQDLRMTGETSSRELILDVRVGRGGDGVWRVTGIEAGAPPAPTGGVSELAERVLAHPGIELPEPGRADIRAGYVDDSILAVLDAVARDHVIDVQVFRTGHPADIFGTDRSSQHTLGRAFDVWRIDGQLVVDPATPRDLLVEVMTAAGLAGATEVGGPFDLNGPRRGYFTDALHADHLHLAVTAGKQPAVP